MFFDYSNQVLVAQALIYFPNAVAPELPTQPSQIKDTTYLIGNPGGGNTIYIEGSVGPDL